MISNFLKQKFIHPIREQLTQGISPKRLALACTVGVALGAFPVFGLTTTLCLIAGVLLKLNQPVLQAVNYLMSPFQLLAIPFFVHYGCVFARSPPLTISPLEVLAEFRSDWLAAFAKYLWIGIHAIFAWAVITPWIAIGVYVITLSILNYWSQRKSLE